MNAITEYNEVETYFHGINNHDFSRLLAQANGDVTAIVLYGRVFNPEMELLEAEAEGDYEYEQGAGYVYACRYEDRDNATPGASAQSGILLMLGWDGSSSVEPISKGGEMLVPVSGYRVLGIVEE